MSSEMLGRCWEAPLDAFAKGVLLVIADGADSRGACSLPSVAKLSSISGVPLYLVPAVLAELKRVKVLVPLQGHGHGQAWRIDADTWSRQVETRHA